jgi:hypothetical protein
MTDIRTVTGGCLCGAVRFSAELPSKWCAHCHCTMCRRAHGAGYVTWVGFEEPQFRLDEGAEHLRWYASSAEAQRGFCDTCGSTMLFRSSKWPGEIHIALANIADPIDRQPQANVFHDTHVDWMPLDDALAAFNPK